MELVTVKSGEALSTRISRRFAKKPHWPAPRVADDRDAHLWSTAASVPRRPEFRFPIHEIQHQPEFIVRRIAAVPPPAPVAHVARTHCLVSFAAGASLLLLHVLTRDLPAIEFGSRTYALSGGVAGLYLASGLLVWFGGPFGRPLSRLCSLVYLVRPSFGFQIWNIMDSPEFRAHFERKKNYEGDSPTDTARGN
jgi:hypothetical protein